MRKWVPPFLSSGLRVQWGCGPWEPFFPWLSFLGAEDQECLTPFPVIAPGGQLLWEILQPYAVSWL